MPANIKGTAELSRFLKQIQHDMLPVTMEVIKDTADTIMNDARKTVPVRTGNLKKSIAVIDQKKDSLLFGASAGYAGFIEWGTSRMKARPFMMPPTKKYSKEIPENVVKRLGRF